MAKPPLSVFGTRKAMVARTIADLDGAQTIALAHLAEAIQYRTYDFSVAEP